MTKGKYAKFPNAPEGSVIEYSEGRTVAWYPKGERKVVKLGGEPLPWEILTADTARDIAEHVEDRSMQVISDNVANILRIYADAVDAMTRKEKGDAD